MDGTESCFYSTPQAIDVADYHEAYHVDAPLNGFGWSPSAGVAAFSWSGSHIHNEAAFYVDRWTGSQWVYVGAGASNTESVQFANQPAGTWTYLLLGGSYADHFHGGVPYGDWISLQVTVGGGQPPPQPPAPPTGVAGSFYFFQNPYAVLLCWYAGAGATWHDLLFLRWNGGFPINQIFSNVTTVQCGGGIGTGPVLSVDDWEHIAVRSCNANGCSGWVDMASPPQWWTYVPCWDVSGVSCGGGGTPEAGAHAH